MKKVLAFLKGEMVLSIALIAALLSMLLVAPDAAYAGYVDWHVLMLLFALMTVVAGFRDAGTFSALSHAMLSRVKTARGIVLCLTLLCFFSSMLITNDVALIVFVPFTIGILSDSGYKGKIIPVIDVRIRFKQEPIEYNDRTCNNRTYGTS